MTMLPDLQAVISETEVEFPKFKLVRKQDSRFMRTLAWVMVGSFMKDYATTIWNTVYLPSSWDALSPTVRCSVLRHERVHMRQAKRLTFPVFALAYLLVFLPLGLAWCRARFEREAYAETLAAAKDYGQAHSDEATRAWFVGQFTGNAYGRMWPFAKTVGKWFDEIVAKLDGVSAK